MKKVLMLVYSHFPRDTRVRREADALVQNGYKVDVVCLRHRKEPRFETYRSINVHRVNIDILRSTKSKYVLLYFSFFIRAIFKLNALYLKEKYDIIHVHNMPDFLVFTTVIPKLFGTKIILDLHDPMPEVFTTKFGLSEGDLLLKSVIMQEKISFKYADKVITTNKAFVDAFRLRGNDSGKITLVMNSPQDNVFNTDPYERKQEDKDKFIVMYHGTIVKRHGLDDAIKAVTQLKEKIPELEFWIFGSGEFLKEMEDEINNSHLNKFIKYKGSVMVDEIAKTIPMIDLGIIPNKKTPFTEINFPVRIFEYLFFQKPVIVSRTKGIRDYFDEDEIFYFEGGNSDDLARVIYKIYSNPGESRETTLKGYEVYNCNNWQKQSNKLINLYKSIMNSNNMQPTL